MRFLLFFLPIILNAQTLRLSAPQLVSGQVFFTHETSAVLDFDLENAVVRYTLQPDKIADKRYRKPLLIRKNACLCAVATHPDFEPGERFCRQFWKEKHLPVSLTLSPAPHVEYAGNKAASLYDQIKGSSDLHDGRWLGFPGDTVVAEAVFSRKIRCKQLVVSTLSDANAWIFPMRSIHVYGKNRRGKWEWIGDWQNENLSTAAEEKPSFNHFISLKIRRKTFRQFKIVIAPYGLIPAPHSGAGSAAWLFLDEIIFQ